MLGVVNLSVKGVVAVFEIFARSIGVTLAFMGQLSSGTAKVSDLFSALGDIVTNVSTRLGKSNQTIAESASTAAAASAKLAKSNADLAASAGQATPALQAAATASTQVGTAAATAGASVQAMATNQTVAASASTGHAAALGAATTATAAVGAAATVTNAQVAGLIDSFAKTTKGTSENAAAFGKLEAALVANRGSMDAAQVASALLGTNVTQLGIAYTNLIAATEKDEAAATKNVQAKQNQGKALTQLIALTGEQAQIQAAALQSAQIQLVADQQLLTLNEKQVGLATAQKAAIESLASATGTLTDQQKTQLTTLDLTIQKYTSEADKSREQVAVINSEIVARQLAVRTYGDQSAGVTDLKNAYDLNVIALNSVVAAQKLGLATDAQVLAQRTKTVVAEGLYRDAVNDTSKAILSRNALAQADSDISIAGIKNKIQAAQVNQQVAASLGDESNATASLIEQKRLQIEIVQRTATAQVASAQAAIDAARQELAVVSPTNDLLIAQINLRIKNAEAKKVEAAGSADVVRGLEAEIAALQRRNSAATVAASLDGSTQRNVQTIDQYVAAEKKAQDEMNHKGSDNTGLSGLQEKQRTGTLSVSDLDTAKAAFTAAQQNYQAFQQNQSAFTSQGAQSVLLNYNAARGILEKLLGDSNLAANKSKASSAAPLTAVAAAASTPAPVSTAVNQPITISFGGNSITRTIGISSPADVQALVTLLQTAAARTGA